MKIRDLEGKEHVWNLSNFIGNEKRKCSDYHARAREILKQRFPCEQILEEVSLPGTNLFGDFYIHKQRLMIEVQGEQHTNYIPFFHKNKQHFGKSKNRDKLKSEWCEINGIKLIEFHYNESDKEWLEKL